MIITLNQTCYLFIRSRDYLLGVNITSLWLYSVDDFLGKYIT